MKEKSIVGDIDVGDLEEDIEYIETLIKIASELPSGELKIQEKEIEVISHILSDYKRVLKENEINEVQEQQLKYYIEELKKYDIRNFKLDDNEQIKSISFTKEQLKFMNLGIALYKNIDKILNDESEEEAIERLKRMIQINNGAIKEARKNGDIFAMQLTADLDTDSIAIETVLSMLEEQEKTIDLMLDNIMTHYQLKTIRKMCCPTCRIAKTCTYSGIHRNCIKQYFGSKAKEE